MTENLNMESVSETLLKWDKQCIKHQLGLPLASVTPDCVGPEGFMLRALMEYFSLYLLDLVARSEPRFEIEEIRPHGNYYTSGSADVPDELSYFVVFKKLNPEGCFFEDVEYGNTGGCKIRVGEKTVREEWADCVTSEGFLSGQKLISIFASHVRKLVGVLNPDMYPGDVAELLAREEWPYITQCNEYLQGVQLTVEFPLLRQLSWQTDSVRICLIPSVKFPRWPSSADFPDRIVASHPLYIASKETASNGFYVLPAGVSSADVSDHCSDWQVSTVTMATQLLNSSPVPLAGASMHRILSGLLGQCDFDKIISEGFITPQLKSAITEEMIATSTLWEMEEDSGSVDWSPSKTADRVMGVLSRLQSAFQGKPMRDYFFPGRNFPEFMNSLLADEIARALDYVKAGVTEKINLDFGHSAQIEKQRKLSESVQQNEQLLRFMERPSVRKFPQGVHEAWRLFAETDLLSHMVYEREPRISVLEFALRFTGKDKPFQAVVMCEFFRQWLTGDAEPARSVQRALQHTRQAVASNNAMDMFHDMDPYMGDALWIAAQSSALQHVFLANTTVQQQPLPGSHVTQPDGWGSSGGRGVYDDAPVHDGFSNGGGSIDDGGVAGDGDTSCCDGDCDCCGDDNACDCGDCNCDCDCDCVIM